MSKKFEVLNMIKEPAFVSDEKNRIVFANRAAEDMFHIERDKRTAESIVPALLLKESDTTAVGILPRYSYSSHLVCSVMDRYRVFIVQDIALSRTRSRNAGFTYAEYLANKVRDSLQECWLAILNLQSIIKGSIEEQRRLGNIIRSYYKIQRYSLDVIELGQETNSIALPMIGFDLLKACKDISEEVNKVLAPRGTTVNFMCDEQKFLFCGNEESIRKLIIRALSAGLCRKKENVHLSIKLIKTEKGLELRFADNCGYIEQETFSDMFNPVEENAPRYMRYSLREDMSIIRHIAELHKGDVVAKRRGEEGLVIVVTMKDMAVPGVFRSPGHENNDGKRSQFYRELSEALDTLDFFPEK